MDEQQRARELLAQAYENEGGWVADAAVEVRAGHLDRHDKAAIAAITAALRAAPEGPNTHYNCKDGIHGTVRRLRRYSTTANNRNSLQGQTMEEAAAFIEHMLAARPRSDDAT